MTHESALRSPVRLWSALSAPAPPAGACATLSRPLTVRAGTITQSRPTA